jgi:hypothetical protein
MVSWNADGRPYAEAMTAEKLDFLIVQNSIDFLGGYVKLALRLKLRLDRLRRTDRARRESS